MKKRHFNGSTVANGDDIQSCIFEIHLNPLLCKFNSDMHIRPVSFNKVKAPWFYTIICSEKSPKREYDTWHLKRDLYECPKTQHAGKDLCYHLF